MHDRHIDRHSHACTYSTLQKCAVSYSEKKKKSLSFLKILNEGQKYLGEKASLFTPIITDPHIQRPRLHLLKAVFSIV